MRVEDLIDVLDYIDSHLKEELFVEDIASKHFVSVSNIQKTFKYAFRKSINEYILNRKFTKAASDLITTNDSILNIALNYGYKNAESFTRGFKKVWMITPSEFRKTRKFACHTPKISLQYMKEGDDTFMLRTKYDITELYDVLNERRNCAYVCIDLCGLSQINESLGIEAGDVALMELRKRVEEVTNDQDIFFRIGGDEFVVFTNSEDTKHAEEIANKVASHNGEKATCNEKEFEVSVHIKAYRKNYDKNLNMNELFIELDNDTEKTHY